MNKQIDELLRTKGKLMAQQLGISEIPTDVEELRDQLQALQKENRELNHIIGAQADGMSITEPSEINLSVSDDSFGEGLGQPPEHENILLPALNDLREAAWSARAVSYTHLTLPTKRIV
eukprot:TRINITY_DN51623_c0_g1_i1.p1 TRINITY_DN51623_c0_g1~~TRINITY_DN51623_c0_g1_i1.p1  ORF type:complete len:119 (-),score=23.20 TRINITY_DN51623_c0_g1_i1:125-481(-)